MTREEYGIGIDIMREKGDRWYEETRRSFRRSKDEHVLMWSKMVTPQVKVYRPSTLEERSWKQIESDTNKALSVVLGRLDTNYKYALLDHDPNVEVWFEPRLNYSTSEVLMTLLF
jgi:hypothetical protein